jgi:hypothetical protein
MMWGDGDEQAKSGDDLLQMAPSSSMMMDAAGGSDGGMDPIMSLSGDSLGSKGFDGPISSKLEMRASPQQVGSERNLSYG